MALTKFEKDMNIIAPLDNEPNDVGGLTATQLKAKFDEGGAALKTYINDTLTTEIDTTLATKAEVQAVVLGQIPDNSITQAKLDSTLSGKIDSAIQPADMIDNNIALSSNVATLLGLTGDPQVKDALSLLSNAVNPLQYVWDKTDVTPTISQEPFNVFNFLFYFGDNGASAYNLTYGDSVEVVNDSLKIRSPITATIYRSSSNTWTTTLRGKYVVGANGKIYSISPSATLSIYSGSESYWTCDLCGVVSFSAKNEYLGEVASFNPNAYPQNGTAGNYKYLCLGRPQYIGARIATGSYKGTGVFGADNPNSIAVGFVPKIGFMNNNFISGVTITYGATTTWHSTDAAKQYNSDGTYYFYTFIG